MSPPRRARGAYRELEFYADLAAELARRLDRRHSGQRQPVGAIDADDLLLVGDVGGLDTGPALEPALDREGPGAGEVEAVGVFELIGVARHAVGGGGDRLAGDRVHDRRGVALGPALT